MHHPGVSARRRAGHEPPARLGTVIVGGAPDLDPDLAPESRAHDPPAMDHASLAVAAQQTSHLEHWSTAGAAGQARVVGLHEERYHGRRRVFARRLSPISGPSSDVRDRPGAVSHVSRIGGRADRASRSASVAGARVPGPRDVPGMPGRRTSVPRRSDRRRDGGGVGRRRRIQASSRRRRRSVACSRTAARRRFPIVAR